MPRIGHVAFRRENLGGMAPTQTTWDGEGVPKRDGNPGLPFGHSEKIPGSPRPFLKRSLGDPKRNFLYLGGCRK